MTNLSEYWVLHNIKFMCLFIFHPDGFLPVLSHIEQLVQIAHVSLIQYLLYI